MKRILIVIVILSMLIALVACSSDSGLEVKGDAIIKKAELTNFEEKLTDVINQHSFVFDLEVKNMEVEVIRATVDYYENSEFVSSVVSIFNPVSEEEKNAPIRAVFMQQITENTVEDNWIASIMTSNGHGSVTSSMKHKEKMSSATWGGIIDETPLMIDEKKVVASIVQTNKNNVSSYVEISSEEQLKDATNYEQVYIISIELN